MFFILSKNLIISLILAQIFGNGNAADLLKLQPHMGYLALLGLGFWLGFDVLGLGPTFRTSF